MSSHRVVVRPVRFTDRMDQMRGFLETLGLRVWPAPPDSP
jgi:hypothetical protein